MAAQSRRRIQRIGLDEARRREKDLVFVDCRSATALARNPSQVRGALHAPVKNLSKAVKQLPRHRTMVTYCT